MKPPVDNYAPAQPQMSPLKPKGNKAAIIKAALLKKMQGGKAC